MSNYFNSAAYQHVFSSRAQCEAAYKHARELSQIRSRPAQFDILKASEKEFVLYCVNRGDFPRWISQGLDAFLKISRSNFPNPKTSSAMSKIKGEIDPKTGYTE